MSVALLFPLDSIICKQYNRFHIVQLDYDFEMVILCHIYFIKVSFNLVFPAFPAYKVVAGFKS